MTNDSSPIRWAERVRSAWDSCALPETVIITDYEPNTPDEWDALDIQQWLAGKRYDEIADTPEMDSEMPFHYLADEASAYLLGSYLLAISRVLDHDGSPGFAVIHFTHFVRSERFREVIQFLSEEQKTVLFQLILAMLGKREACGLDEADIVGLEMAATLV